MEIYNRDIKSLELVGRSVELRMFHKNVRLIEAGQPQAKPIINFWGIPGIGKTTLLRKIRQSRTASNEKTILIDFEELFIAYGQFSFNQLMQTIVAETQKEFDTLAHPNRERRRIPGNTDYLSRKVIDILKRYIAKSNSSVLLVFDGSQYCEPEVFDLLERFVLSPLLSVEKVMILLGSQVPRKWTRFDVRQSSIEKKLLPFDRELVWQQLGAIDEHKNLADKIYGITYGVPACNQIASRYLTNLHSKRSTPKRLVKSTISIIAKKEVEYFWGRTGVRLTAEQKYILKAMSVTRWFNYSLLDEILSAIHPEKYHKMKASKFRDITSKLEETNLVQWEIQNKGFSIDITLRRILVLDMKFNNPRVLKKIRKLVTSWFKTLSQQYDPPQMFILDLIYYRALFYDFELMLSDVNDFLKKLRTHDSSNAEKLMLLDQLTRTTNEPEFADVMPGDYVKKIAMLADSSINEIKIAELPNALVANN